MSKKAAKNKATEAVIPIRIPADLKNRVENVAAHSRLTQAEVTRQAIARGIGELEAFFVKPAKVAA